MLVTRSAGGIVGASALAGFGASFGRDVYRFGKRNAGEMLLYALVFCIIALPIAGAFFAARLFCLNYPTAGSAIRMRLLAVVMLPVALILGYLPLQIIAAVSVNILERVFDTALTSPDVPSLLYAIDWQALRLINVVLPVLNNPTFGASLPGMEYLGAKYSFVGVLLMLGILSGLLSRKRRKLRFEATVHNEAFMCDVGLFENASGLIEDAEGNTYRIEGRLDRRIELFAVGRRNRRGFIDINETGKFVRWSGLVKL